MTVKGPRVLVVDDEADVRTFVRLIFEARGYAVETADDGEKALAAIEASPPDLVVLDIMMPLLDGWEVLRRLRGRPAPPVIVVSAAGDPERARDLGAAACFSKPFQVKDFLRTAEAVLKPL